MQQCLSRFCDIFRSSQDYFTYSISMTDTTQSPLARHLYVTLDVGGGCYVMWKLHDPMINLNVKIWTTGLLCRTGMGGAQCCEGPVLWGPSVVGAQCCGGPVLWGPSVVGTSVVGAQCCGTSVVEVRCVRRHGW